MNVEATITGHGGDAWGGLAGQWHAFGAPSPAVLPIILGAAYFLVGFAVYQVRCWVWGEADDKEVKQRGESTLLGFHLRHYFVWITRPLWLVIMASGVGPMTITAAAIALGLAAGVAVGMGRFGLGGWLFLFSGILDAMDGRVARARGQVSRAGGAVDSVLDRYADSAMLMGLGWYYRDSWVLLLVLLAMVGTSMVPYVRAKAESLGVAMHGGIMQRAERMLFLGVAVTLSALVEAGATGGGGTAEGPQAAHLLAVVGIAFLAIGSNVTGFTRFRDLVIALRRQQPQSQPQRQPQPQPQPLTPTTARAN